jgi:hypothetical protein
MSGTRRVPLARRSAAQITPAALDAFRRIRLLETQCTCLPRDWQGEYGKHEPCSACDAWWTQQGILCRELALKAWHWPAVEHPQAENPYPEGSAAAERWHPNVEARSRWRLLDAAASEPRRGRRKRTGRNAESTVC